MAESVVSFITQHIESKIGEGANGLVKVKTEANSLLLALKTVNNLLNERIVGFEEQAKLSSSNELQSWAEKVRRIAYEAEDEVDTLVSEPSVSPFYILGRHRASKKLQGLEKRAMEAKTKLGEGSNESNREVKARLSAGSNESNREVISRARGSQAPKGHLPAGDDLVIGIDDEVSKVVDLLTRKSELKDGQQTIDKLAIVGMGGLGKTTFARSIYNHKAVMKHFHFQAWVSVSQGWETSLVLRRIFEQIPGQKGYPANKDEVEDEQHTKLITRLNYLLYEKNCLLVLDDVWDMKSLHKFSGLIQQNDNESKITYTIVITSRQCPVNRIDWHIHQLQNLTNEDCWKLFSRVASKSPNALSTEYHTIAMEMLKKCQGLPLAVVALGRLLKTKDTMREWQRVLYQIEGAEATSMYGQVNEILGLSYDQLPFYLKPCFLYLGIFPEGSTISGGTLIRMWVAEGFIICNESERDETLEDAGIRYLQELIDHNMVQVVRRTYSGKAKTIRIHDIMRDFCILKARELDFLAVPSIGPNLLRQTSRRMGINLSKSLDLPTNNPHLRSLVFGQPSTSTVSERFTRGDQANQIYLNLANVCQMYKLVRVLDIFGIKSPDGTLPKEIGSLVHLTYLRIRSTNIRELPRSIRKLRNLLTLDYWDVYVDTKVEVPNVLWKLQKLKHLFLPNEMGGMVETLKLDTLTDLITLWGAGGGNWMLKEMESLSPTLRKLYIHRISTKDQINVVLDKLDKAKDDCLYSLALDWYGFENTNLSTLCSKKNLRTLRLIGRAPDTSYPNGFQFPSNLGKLELCYTQLEKPETLSLLGKLSFLKVLRLSKDSYVGSEWNLGKDAFPVLEELKMTSLPKLEKWEMEDGAMHCLRKLSIVSCIKLNQMPMGLKFIESLEKLAIERMPGSFISKLQKADGRNATGGENYHIIKHIPQVLIRNPCGPIPSESKLPSDPKERAGGGIHSIIMKTIGKLVLIQVFILVFCLFWFRILKAILQPVSCIKQLLALPGKIFIETNRRKWTGREARRGRIQD